MKKIEPVENLSDEERELLIDALTALRTERGKAWNAACDKAEVEGKRQPSLRSFGINDIIRLARRIGGRSANTYWLERYKNPLKK